MTRNNHAAAKPNGVTVLVEVLAGRNHMSALEGLAKRGDATFMRVLKFVREQR